MNDFPLLKRRALAAGIGAAVVAAVGAAFLPRAFFEAYLFAWILALEVALGSMGWIMLHHLTGGRWGLPARSIWEACALTVPVLAVLFVPLLFGLGALYPWARPAVVTADPLIAAKTLYLNVPFFLIRTAIYLVVWSLLAAMLTREADAGRLRAISAVGMIVLVLTSTFSAIDWTMSLEPVWYSSAYGLVVLGGQFLAALAFAIVVTASVTDRAEIEEVATPGNYHDLGNLLLAAVMTWAYVAFSQYLIIWNGDLPNEIGHYLRRREGFWLVVTGAIMLFQFAAPFVLLLFRAVKRSETGLAVVASGLLAVHALEVYWRIVPAFTRPEALSHWLDLVAPVAVGGLWLAAFAWQLGRRPLVSERREEVIRGEA